MAEKILLVRAPEVVIDAVWELLHKGSLITEISTRLFDADVYDAMAKAFVSDAGE